MTLPTVALFVVVASVTALMIYSVNKFSEI